MCMLLKLVVCVLDPTFINKSTKRKWTFFFNNWKKANSPLPSILAVDYTKLTADVFLPGTCFKQSTSLLSHISFSINFG